MKKRILSLLAVFALCIALLVPLCGAVFAATRQYIFDDTGVFSDEDIAELDDLAEQIFKAHGFHVAFLKVSDAGEYNADGIDGLLSSFYQKEYGEEDGIILGHDEQYWSFYCSGSANSLFTDADIDSFWTAYDISQTYVGGVKSYFAKVEPHLGGTLVVSPIIGEETTIKSGSRLNDMANLLTDQQEASLLARLNEVSLRQNFDLVVVTADSLGGKYYVDYADDYFDYNGFGLGENKDGALLLISMEPNNRKCYISTSGRGISVLNDRTIESMLDVIVDKHLSYGEYYEAMNSFVSLCDDKLTPSTSSEQVTGWNDGFLAEEIKVWVGVSLVIGLISALIRIAILKSKMKSVRTQGTANNYIVGDLNVTRSYNLFLYRTVSQSKRESSSSSSSGDSSTHISSSGSSHGGGGRSF